jgi:IS30 family transposase
MAYTHLTSEERHYIETRLKLKESPSKIALALGRNQSTISRELNRNSGKRSYRHKQAHRKAQQRHADKPKAVKLTTDLLDSIDSLLAQQWSPEQISGRLQQEGKAAVCHETNYQHVLEDKQAGGQLYLNLRLHAKKYRKRYGSTTGSVKGIPTNRVDIDERPDLVNLRARLGDWEADTMIGKGHQGALVTLDERKSKLRLAFLYRTRPQSW